MHETVKFGGFLFGRVGGLFYSVMGLQRYG
jgi:hypothetical protein